MTRIVLNYDIRPEVPAHLMATPVVDIAKAPFTGGWWPAEPKADK